MKFAHSEILTGEASGVRASYAVRSPRRAGPKRKFMSIAFREVGRQLNVLRSPAAANDRRSGRLVQRGVRRPFTLAVGLGILANRRRFDDFSPRTPGAIETRQPAVIRALDHRHYVES